MVTWILGWRVTAWVGAWHIAGAQETSLPLENQVSGGVGMNAFKRALLLIRLTAPRKLLLGCAEG